MTIAELLQFLRNKGLSDQQIADSLNMSITSIFHLRTGKSRKTKSRDKSVLLAKTYGSKVTFDENNVPEFQPLEPYEQKMFDYKQMDRLPEDKVREPIELLHHESAQLKKTVEMLLKENNDLKSK